MTPQRLNDLLDELVKQPTESEWVEFKHNFHSAEEIGERISAISNGACLQNQAFGYLVFGIQDITHQILGTSFKAKTYKKGGEDLEHWLATRLNPRIDFSVFEFDYDEGRHISMYVIPATNSRPVEFLNKPYIRVGSITRNLGEFPDKEARIWRKQFISFEKEIAEFNLNASDVIRLLSTQTYFDLLKLPYPSDQRVLLINFFLKV